MGFSLSNIFGGGPTYATTTQTRTAGPYAPYIKDVLAQGKQAYYGQDPTYSSLYRGLSANTQAGVDQLAAFQPTASDAASGMLTKTLNGDYLDPNSNPWLKQTYGTAADQFEADLRSRFGATGSTGTGAFTGAAGQGLSSLAGDIYGGNYQAERNRQMGAAGLAPGVDQGTMLGAQAKIGAGSIQDQDTLQRLAEQNRQTNFGYDSKWDELARYLGVVSPATSGYGTATTNSPFFRNRGSGILGGALGGAKLGSNFNSEGGTPWGTIIGAVGGGLLGGYG